MKVLKEGPGWSIEQTCTGAGNGGGGCGAKLLVERDDIYITSSSDFTGDTEYYFTFRCPCCNIETDIADSKVPIAIQRIARERRAIEREASNGEYRRVLNR